MIGIYKITCIENDKKYIGSSFNIDKRWDTHKRDLLKYTHHNKYLQEDWIKYGEKSFKFELLEELETTNKKNLEDLEYKYIDICENSYNILGKLIDRNYYNPYKNNNNSKSLDKIICKTKKSEVRYKSMPKPIFEHFIGITRERFKFVEFILGNFELGKRTIDTWKIENGKPKYHSHFNYKYMEKIINKCEFLNMKYEGRGYVSIEIKDIPEDVQYIPYIENYNSLYDLEYNIEYCVGWEGFWLCSYLLLNEDKNNVFMDLETLKIWLGIKRKDDFIVKNMYEKSIKNIKSELSYSIESEIIYSKNSRGKSINGVNILKLA